MEICSKKIVLLANMKEKKDNTCASCYQQTLLLNNGCVEYGPSQNYTVKIFKTLKLK
jgi:hypothetical protein